MAKINIDTIPGYAEMSAEDKLKALEGYEFEVEDATKLKNALNKASSDCAEYKRQLKALQEQKLTDEEKAKLEREEAEKTLKAELESLKREKTIATYKANYLANGYDDALAASTAEALANGDMNTVFANQKTYNDSVMAKAKESLLNNQPGLSKGNPPKADPDGAEVDAFTRAIGI